MQLFHLQKERIFFLKISPILIIKARNEKGDSSLRTPFSSLSLVLSFNGLDRIKDPSLER
jgi:hypothetical protein